MYAHVSQHLTATDTLADIASQSSPLKPGARDASRGGVSGLNYSANTMSHLSVSDDSNSSNSNSSSSISGGGVDTAIATGDVTLPAMRNVSATVRRGRAV